MLVRKLPHTGGESLAEGVGVARAAVVSFTSACRRCMGCDWRGHRLLRNGTRIRQIAGTIWPPDCGLPTGAGKTRLDGAGDYEGATAGVASHTHDGSGQSSPCAHLLGEGEK